MTPNTQDDSKFVILEEPKATKDLFQSEILHFVQDDSKFVILNEVKNLGLPSISQVKLVSGPGFSCQNLKVSRPAPGITMSVPAVSPIRGRADAGFIVDHCAAAISRFSMMVSALIPAHWNSKVGDMAAAAVFPFQIGGLHHYIIRV